MKWNDTTFNVGYLNISKSMLIAHTNMQYIYYMGFESYRLLWLKSSYSSWDFYY